MSITIKTDLPIVAPVDNPMELILNTDNMLSDAGSQAVFDLAFTDIDETISHVISFGWQDTSVGFILVADPDDSGTQLPVANTGEALAAWLIRLAFAFTSNYYIERDFVVSVVDGTTVRFTAKEKGEAYTVAVYENYMSNCTPASTPGEDVVARSYYNLLIRLFEANDSGQVFLGEDRIAPDSSGDARFDIHELLKGSLTPEFTWPDNSQTVIYERDNFIQRYQIRYAENYDRQVRIVKGLGQDYYAILGGFDYKMLAALNGRTYSFSDFITTFKAFLTWQPISKLINSSQPEKLFFFMYAKDATLTVKVKINYTDGTNSTHDVFQQMFVQYQVYELLTGVTALDLGQYSAKTIKSYEYWLEDSQGDPVSHIRTYIVDWREYRFERIFLFRNSFGAYDVFRAIGGKKSFNEYERMILERNISDFSVTEQYKILETQNFEVNTGFVDKSTKNWLRELLLSEEAYEVIGEYLFPILIQNKKTAMFNDLDSLHDLTIKYKYAFKNPNYNGLLVSQPLLAENLEILLSEDGEWLFT